MKVHIDGDVLRYRIGFACEYRLYHIFPIQHEVEKTTVRGVKKFNAAIKEYGEETPYVYEDVLEPVENCLHSVKQQLNQIIGRCNATECEIYLTGKGNFREEVATIKPYKGNRPDRKPKHYDAITDYLMSKAWNARMIEGMEADDALAIALTDDPDGSCVATIDKDLWQVPGRHYDFYHNKRLRISDQQGLRNLYIQIIAGDATDNIGGVPGIGVKGADRLLGSDESEVCYYRIAKQAYIDSYNRNNDSFKGLEPIPALLENARLVYMLRSIDDEWNPPEVGCEDVSSTTAET